jgi:hypothetical protein
MTELPAAVMYSELFAPIAHVDERGEHEVVVAFEPETLNGNMAALVCFMGES